MVFLIVVSRRTLFSLKVRGLAAFEKVLGDAPVFSSREKKHLTDRMGRDDHFLEFFGNKLCR